MTTNKPVQTFREGPIAASVWERTGSRGRYHEVTLSRSYRQSGDKGFGYSGSFRERDEVALKICIERAGEWIRRQGGIEPQADEANPTAEADAPMESVADFVAVAPCDK